MNPKTVLIHRRFEYDDTVISDGHFVPTNFEVLKLFLKRRWSHVFHKIVNKDGFEIKGLQQWLDGKEAAGGIQTEVKYNNSKWEPQFVALNAESTPFHDETFLYRSRSNVQWVHELCRANFTFKVLNRVFTVHSGIKRAEKQEFRELIDKAVQSGLQKQILTNFKNRLDQMYPYTEKFCPFFDYPK
ncbi:unnamed protein product [Bursaphelenchus okinawaensis]|uniref:Uncharacterized protein n=1 Tax=Bursaphelenchus okinawaensis TaxID=465554 RepID=A0A811KT94_9BILA|nr:unnamed protein product [Bursaphelenchus okinawaensis]CAG9111283.1 unnamed protein product [Bursaphelenchus okinawaensis]